VSISVGDLKLKSESEKTIVRLVTSF